MVLGNPPEQITNINIREVIFVLTCCTYTVKFQLIKYSTVQANTKEYALKYFLD